MIIRSVDACWLSVPIPTERQHVSDFGRISSFDMALVRIEVASGLVGWGESKAAVGSAGSCAALVSLITDELGPATRRSGRASGHAALGGDVQRHPRALCAQPWAHVSGARTTRAQRRGDERRRHGVVGSARQVARRAGRRPVGWGVPSRHAAVRQWRLGGRRRNRSRAERLRRRVASRRSRCASG